MRKIMLVTIGLSSALFLKLSFSILPFWVYPCIIAFALYLCLVRFPIKKPMASFLYIASGILFGGLYLHLFTVYYHQPVKDFHNTSTEVEFVLLEFPEKQSYSYSVIVELQLPSQVTAKTLLYTDEQVANLQPGDRVRGTVDLFFADETYDGVAITVYTSKGILMRGKTQGELVYVESTRNDLRHIPTYMASYLRQSIFSVFPDPYSAIILALVTGNKEELSLEFSSDLSRAGLSHMVAVSGMHLGFLAFVIHLFLPKNKWWSVPIFSLLMIVFMLMSGSTPSIMRATVMAIIMKLSTLFHRERDNFTALSTAILLILLQNPYAITHIGLHLSVASIVGIFLWAEPIQKYLMELFQVSKDSTFFQFKKYVIISIATSISAISLTTPLVALYFGSVSLVSPLSNLLALFVVSIVFAGGLIASGVGIFLPSLGKILALVVIPLIDYLEWVVSFLAKIPFASVTLDSVYYCSWLIFVYLLCAICLCLKEKTPVLFVFSSIFSTFIVSAVLHSGHIYSNSFYAHVFDTGQGQSALFALGNTLILSDCGGNAYENAGDIAANALGNMGRTHLDLLVISHCDTDHMNGVVQLMHRVKVDRIAMPPLDEEDSRQLAIVEKAEECGTELWYIHELQEIFLEDGGVIRIFPSVGSGSTNETGISLMVSVNDYDVLVTGDIGASTEENLVEQFQLSEVEVWFVSHHGSRFSTSSKFLDVITPQQAIICVGGSNNYGHPTGEVLDKLEEREIFTYRTDELGALYFYLPK